MDTRNNNDLADKNWNNEKKPTDLNEGFSGDNLPKDYNPKKGLEEQETDAHGDTKTVDRARNASQAVGDENKPNLTSGTSDSEKLKSREDHNYDDPKRHK